jgi:hypothetical protein
MLATSGLDLCTKKSPCFCNLSCKSGLCRTYLPEKRPLTISLRQKKIRSSRVNLRLIVNQLVPRCSTRVAIPRSRGDKIGSLRITFGVLESTLIRRGSFCTCRTSFDGSVWTRGRLDQKLRVDAEVKHATTNLVLRHQLFTNVCLKLHDADPRPALNLNGQERRYKMVVHERTLISNLERHYGIRKFRPDLQPPPSTMIWYLCAYWLAASLTSSPPQTPPGRVPPRPALPAAAASQRARA